MRGRLAVLPPRAAYACGVGISASARWWRAARAFSPHREKALPRSGKAALLREREQAGGGEVFRVQLGCHAQVLQRQCVALGQGGAADQVHRAVIAAVVAQFVADQQAREVGRQCLRGQALEQPRVRAPNR